MLNLQARASASAASDNYRDLKLPFAANGLRQTANLKKFLCNKIKIMNREIFELYDLIKESTMLH